MNILEHFQIEGDGYECPITYLVCTLCKRKGDRWHSNEFCSGSTFAEIQAELSEHWNERHQYDHLQIVETEHWNERHQYDHLQIVETEIKGETKESIYRSLEKLQSSIRRIEFHLFGETTT